ncbi:hypothetical protein CCAX7_53210 [Capsulimonas corticalis]|uniref:Uncharacterized protein n=1 Tax=Capsulimonas corticalis TaxID=2219043 RepID=A0A402CNR0_9BACT|nr:ADP-ribosylglycohydrolase family protein [Capsulimonas corticalis]BDI33270.1 hypothetical protein CCAX7_53210 [Capsulimonas corticalis]
MADIQETLLDQWAKRAVWLDGCDIETEYRQAREEGRSLASVEQEFQALIATPRTGPEWRNAVGGARGREWMQRVGDLIDRVQTLPFRADYQYEEPSDLDGIRQSRPASVDLPLWSGSDLEWERRLHGALLGRTIGCMLGKPVEGWDVASIRVTAEATGNWPLTDYLRKPTEAEDAAIETQSPKHRLHSWHAPMLRGTMHGMVEDDDTNYTTIGYSIVREFGKDFQPLDVAVYWCQNVPILHTCTAERIAYRNFVVNVLPPQSATARNPYREWIGAQIRADYFGYANPGNPTRAAEWAWRDASISHIKNGIYGEMWVAAMLAAAYVENDWVKVIRTGLAQIPALCRLREDIEGILTLYAEGVNYDGAVAAIHKQWNETNPHDWCHTNSNAQIVALGLLYGEDDFEKTITRAVMAGFDTDCNGATCGSLWGVKHGFDAIPNKWSEPISDTLRTGVVGYHEVAISKLAADMLETARKER